VAETTATFIIITLKRGLQNRPFQTFNRQSGILWSTDFSLLFFGSWIEIPRRQVRQVQASAPENAGAFFRAG